MRALLPLIAALTLPGCLDKALQDALDDAEDDIADGTDGADGGGGDGGGAPTTYAGQTLYGIGAGELGAPDDLCVYFWDDSGEPTEPCPDCDWAFDLHMNFDADNSDQYVDGCPDLGDMDLTIGYDSGYDGGPIIWVYDSTYGEWYPSFGAQMDGDQLIFGYYEYVASDYYGGYYYTYTWYSSAQVK